MQAPAVNPFARALFDTPPVASPSPAATLVVLAGGRSRRFGASKIDLRVDGRPLLAHLAARFRTLAPGGAWLLRPPGRRPAGMSAYDRVLTDDRPHAGPAAGLLTALRRLPAATPVIVIAADAPRLRPALGRRLLEALKTQHAPAVMGRWRNGPSRGRVDPLPSAWLAGPGAALLAGVLARGERSLRRTGIRFDLATLPLTTRQDAAGYIDIDHPGDLERLPGVNRP